MYFYLSGALVIFFRAGYEFAALNHCAIFAQFRRKTQLFCVLITVKKVRRPEFNFIII